MISKEDVLSVAQDLNFHPTEEQIQEVINGYEEEADSDPSGCLPLWIENLLYSLGVKQFKKVTATDVLNWHGSDHGIQELAETLANIANGEYDPELCRKEILGSKD